MKNTALFMVSSMLLVLVIVSPLPTLVHLTPQPVLKVKEVVVTTTTSIPVNVKVGEAPSTGNETIGFVWGGLPYNNVYYVRLTALDVYQDNTWSIGNYTLREVEGLFKGSPNYTLEHGDIGNNSRGLAKGFDRISAVNVYFNITSLDLIPTLEPSIKIILVPQPVLYDDIVNWTIVRLSYILVDNSSKFIAVRTLYITNTTNYTVTVKWPTEFRPYPLLSNYSLIARVLSVKVASIIGPPANESTIRVRELALLLRHRFYNMNLSSLLRYIIKFLHTTTRYNPHPPPTPKGRDLVDYFLYTSLKGSCLHYASALAIILRDMGFKARVVLGYITKPYNATHRIIKNPPHLWVELFIPNYGWLQIDPTPPVAYNNPSSTVLAGIEKRITKYVSGEFKRELEAFKRASRRVPRTPESYRGNNSTSPGNSFMNKSRTVTRSNTTNSNMISFQWIMSGIIGLTILVYAIIVIVNVYDRKKKSLDEEVKNILKEILSKKNIRLPLDYMTPREAVLKIIEEFPDDVKRVLLKFLEIYEKARYGGEKRLLGEAVSLLRKVYDMV